MKNRIALAIAMFLLSSCAAIPSAGPIQIINNPDSQTDLNAVRVIAKPPTARMNAVQIASGFVAANISTFGDFNVARKFLTSNSSSSWQPLNFDVLDSASIQFNDLGTGIVEISALQIGKLKSSHRFEIFPIAKPFLLKLRIESRKSGLRISSAIQNGILLSSDLVRGYSPYNVYFGNENFSRLVAEVVWLPKNEKSLATKLTNSLLLGSRESFKTAIPDGTDLKFGSVTISNGTAVVNLNASALSADNAQRKFMIAQFVWTLQGISGVGRIQIATNDRILSTAGKTYLNRKDFLALDPDYQKKENGIFTLQAGLLSSQNSGLISEIGNLGNATEFAISDSQDFVAYVIGSQLRLAAATKLKQYVIVSQNSSKIGFDNQNRLWFVKDNGRLYCRLSAGGTQEVLRIPEGTISDFSISPDSGRIALIVSNKTNSKLFVGSLVSENEILNIVNIHKVEQSFTEVHDVDWMNSLELAGIGKVGLSESVTAQISLTNGALRTLNAPKTFEFLNTSSQGMILAGTKLKTIWIFENGLWTRLDSNSQAVFSK